MIATELAEKWRTIEELPREGDYDLILISPECRAELSLGISPAGCRCLILVLPPRFAFNCASVEGDRLSLEFDRDRNFIVLTLGDSDYRDLFDDLVLSFFNSVHEIEDASEYSAAFVATFRKWSRFFEIARGDRVPRDVIQGIFGELIVLRQLLGGFSGPRTNDILAAWRGPYDRGPDFVLDDRDIEAKTRLVVNTTVRIGTEDQLDQREGKGLELAVVSLDPDHPDAMSLSELTSEVADIVQAAGGDTAILYLAMSQKGLVPGNLNDYDDVVFRPSEIVTYDCLAAGFPRLARSELPEAIFRVSYSLNIAKLSDFLLSAESL